MSNIVAKRFEAISDAVQAELDEFLDELLLMTLQSGT